MKKVLEFLQTIGAKVDEKEVRRAYKRESAQFGISPDSPRQIWLYLKNSGLIQ